MVSVQIFFILLFSFSSWAKPPECDPNVYWSLKDISETTRATFDETEEKRREGDENSCSSAQGIWCEKESCVRVSSVQGTSLGKILRVNVHQVFAVENISPDGTNQTKGILIETTQGWKYANLSESCRSNIQLKADDYKIDYSDKVDLGKYQIEKYSEAALSVLETGKPNECVASVTDADLSDKKTFMKIGEESYRFDGVKSLKKYLETAQPSTKSLLENNPMRIPPQMYEVFKKPEYKKAIEEKKFSTALDLLYKKALELGGDQRTALILSQMMVDVRQRGTCGAVYGLRGRQTPPSIFDGEKFGMLKENRLDAAPHFFSYALIAKDGYPLVGELSSAYTRHQKTKEGSVRFHFNAANRKSWGSRRPQYDLNADSFYNDLGIKYGLALYTKPDALPSEILNRKDSENRKVDIGLGTSRQPNWESYDPITEAPEAVPDRKRITYRSDYPPWPEKSASIEEEIEIYDSICNTSARKSGRDYYKVTHYACTKRNEAIRLQLKNLKEKVAVPKEELIKKGWLDPE